MSAPGSDLLYKTVTLTRTINDLRTPDRPLMSMGFGTMQRSETQEIMFDMDSPDQGLMPFSSPLTPAPLLQEKDHFTKSLRPATLQYKTPLDTQTPYKRAMGEGPLGGSMSPRERRRMQTNRVLVRQRNNWMNRLEWMAAKSLVDDGYIVGLGDESYPLRTLSFGRPANHRISLSGNRVWTSDHADSDPGDHFQEIAALMARNGGGTMRSVILGRNAWTAFRKHEAVTEKLDRKAEPITSVGISTGVVNMRGLSHQGTFDGVNIYIHMDWYVSDGKESRLNAAGTAIEEWDVARGTLLPFIPLWGALFVDPDAYEGVRAYGLIRDDGLLEGNGDLAMPLYTDSWQEDDPKQRFIRSQSCALLYPHRPQASVFMTVGSGGPEK